MYTLEGVDSSSLANKVAKVAGSINLGEVASHAILRMAAGDAVLETVKEFDKHKHKPHITKVYTHK